ncbi:hypothetical protein [Microbispora sp. NPDC049633]
MKGWFRRFRHDWEGWRLVEAYDRHGWLTIVSARTCRCHGFAQVRRAL